MDRIMAVEESKTDCMCEGGRNFLPADRRRHAASVGNCGLKDCELTI